MGTRGRFRRFFVKFILWSAVIVPLIAIIIIGVAAWRLHNSPILLPQSVQDVIERKIQSQGASVEISNAMLYWPHIASPVYVQMHEVDIASKTSDNNISLKEVSASLSAFALLTGKMRIKGVIVNSPKVRFACKDGWKFCFLSDEEGGSWNIPNVNNFEKISKDIKSALPPALSSLKLLKVNDIDVSVFYGQNNEQYKMPALQLILAKSGKKIAAEFLFGKDKSASLLSGVVVIDNEDEFIEASIKAKKVSPHLFSKLLSKLPKFNENMPDVSVYIRAKYEPKPQAFTLKSFLVSDGKSNINLSGALAHEEDDNLWRGPFVATLDSIEQEYLENKWPIDVRKNPAYEWLGEKSNGGELKNINAKAIVEISKNEDGVDFKTKDASATFDIENLNLNYMAPLWSLEKINGTGSIDANSQMLKIHTKAGTKIRSIDMNASDIEIDHIFTDNVGRIKVKSSVSGAIKDMARYLSLPPINAGEFVNVNPDGYSGDFNLDLDLDFPTQPNRPITDVGITAKGSLLNARIPNAIDNIALEDAKLNLSLENWLIELEGTGKVLGGDVKLKSSKSIIPDAAPYKERLSVQMVVNRAFLNVLGIDLYPYIVGEIGVNASSTTAVDGTSHIGINADLTNAYMSARPLDYVKKIGQKASAALEIGFASDGGLKDLKILSVKSDGMEILDALVKFDGGNFNNAKPVQISIPRAVIGKTDAAISYVVDSGNSRLGVDAKSIDLFSLDDKNNKNLADLPPMDISVVANDLQVSGGHVTKSLNLKAKRRPNGSFSRMAVDLNTNPGKLSIRYGKQENKEKCVFDMRASDAGSALDGIGVPDKLIGGEFFASGECGEGYSVSGGANISNFSLVKAPILAQVLGAMTANGLNEILNGDGGMSFDAFQTNFLWKWRPQGALVTFSDGRSYGNSMGITFSGSVDMANMALDLAGTIVPISGLNRAAAGVPIIGSIITGTKKGGGIFAATYSVGGSIDNPKVSTNPMSVLAPGIIRTILFEQK